MTKRYTPDDPREWLNRAISSLIIAKHEDEGVYLEDLCYQAQQAVEKAIKAILIKFNIEFPYAHNISQLLSIIEDTGLKVSETIKESERLTPFATIVRYPGIAPPIEYKDYLELIDIADKVIKWAKHIVLD